MQVVFISVKLNIFSVNDKLKVNLLVYNLLR
jgi:hypothetical protein